MVLTSDEAVVKVVLLVVAILNMLSYFFTMAENDFQ